MNVRNWITTCFLIFMGWFGCAQVPEIRPAVTSPEFDQRLTRLLSFSVPLIGVEALQAKLHHYQLLDTRERSEYDVSHLPNAIWIGYDQPDFSVLRAFPKDQPLVLYCSVGYRSEKIGEKLKEMGYQNVFNLYGSIFEWANKGYALEDNAGNPASKIHTYNKNWGKWMQNDNLEKVD